MNCPAEIKNAKGVAQTGIEIVRATRDQSVFRLVNYNNNRYLFVSALSVCDVSVYPIYYDVSTMNVTLCLFVLF